MAYGRSAAMEALANRIMMIPEIAGQHEYRMGQLGIQQAGLQNALEQQKWERGMREKDYNLALPAKQLQASIAEEQMQPYNYTSFTGKDNPNIDLDNQSKLTQTFFNAIEPVVGKGARFDQASGNIIKKNGQPVTYMEHNLKYAEPFAHMYAGDLDEWEFLKGIAPDKMTPQQKTRLAEIEKNPGVYYAQATQKGMMNLSELESLGLKREHLQGIIDKINWSAKQKEAVDKANIEIRKQSGREKVARIGAAAKITAAGITAAGKRKPTTWDEKINTDRLKGLYSKLDQYNAATKDESNNAQIINKDGSITTMGPDQAKELQKTIAELEGKLSGVKPPPPVPAPKQEWTLEKALESYSILSQSPDPGHQKRAQKVANSLSKTDAGRKALEAIKAHPETPVVPGFSVQGRPSGPQAQMPAVEALKRPIGAGSGFERPQQWFEQATPETAQPYVDPALSALTGRFGKRISSAVELAKGVSPALWTAQPGTPQPTTSPVDLAKQWASKPIEEIIGDIQAVVGEAGPTKSFGPELDELIRRTYENSRYNAASTAYSLMDTMGIKR